MKVEPFGSSAPGQGRCVFISFPSIKTRVSFTKSFLKMCLLKQKLRKQVKKARMGLNKPSAGWKRVNVLSLWPRLLWRSVALPQDGGETKPLLTNSAGRVKYFLFSRLLHQLSIFLLVKFLKTLSL